jgi:hypothetical protein
MLSISSGSGAASRSCGFCCCCCIRLAAEAGDLAVVVSEGVNGTAEAGREEDAAEVAVVGLLRACCCGVS